MSDYTNEPMSQWRRETALLRVRGNFCPLQVPPAAPFFRFHLPRSIYQLRRWWVQLDETVSVSLVCRSERDEQAL